LLQPRAISLLCLIQSNNPLSEKKSMRAGFLLQEEEEEERAKGHSLLDSTAQSSGIRRDGESKN